MRFRLFGRVVYVRKGALVLVLVLAIAAVSAAVYFAEKDKGPPEIERAADEQDSGEKSADTDSLASLPPDGTAAAVIDAASPSPLADMRIAVHITGAVAEEGVYWLEPGSIVQDAVDMCGGLLPDADTYCINLAMKVNDGMRIHIPSVYSEDKKWLLDVGYASTQVSSNGSSGIYGTAGLVNINTASVNELVTLSGIGESTAREIIAFREEHGRFETIEDIMNVPGIKDAKFARIKKFITV
ncbi:MAG: helix-hairpin-helix domain-containing protein [Clostridia bacterium]|nr:helix-hairpin-helix domain-containing protein [Clostridia bacterium]